jgi:3',5'-cyclic AMP phosphodiesterase CpdA
VSDTHIGANLDYSNQGIPDVLSSVSAQIRALNPDFLINLGDILDFHQFGFNDAVPSDTVARDAYLNYRTLLGDTASNVAHFPVIGNWDGENGSYTSEEIERARSQRLLYLPSPSPTAYPEGTGPFQDYYAFSWGDALFVILNVMTYTPTEHLLSSDPGLPDDWTLGQEQLEWLSATLAAATSKWRFLFIHHTVGGKAGNESNSAYGRGGGQAAYVGEQAIVHQLMLDHGVQIFFYGHDHAFVDMEVDGIHYTMPGSAGAPWTFTTAETGYEEYWPDSGWATVDVSPDAVGVRFHSEQNGALYEYGLE